MNTYRQLIKVILFGNPGTLLLSTIVVTSIIGAACSLTIPLMVQQSIDGFVQLDLFNALPLIILLGLWITNSLFGGLNSYLIGKIGVRMILNLRGKLFSNAVKLPLTYYDETASTEPASRMVNDSVIISDLVARESPPVIGGSLTMVGSLVILWILDWKLTIVMFGALIVAFTIIIPISVKLIGISRLLQEKEATLMKAILEALSNIRLIKASIAEQVSIGGVNKTLGEMYKLHMKAVMIHSILNPVSGMTVLAAMIIILSIAAFRVSAGEMSMGTLVSYVIYVNSIVFPMILLVTFKAKIDAAAGAAGRVYELLNMKTENYGNDSTAVMDDTGIKFSGVSFQYEEDKLVLNNLDLNVLPYQTVALVGESGAGKSTLFSLLLKFYDSTEGEIYVGGRPIGEYSRTNLRKNIAYIAQDAPLLSSTIRENMVLGLDCTVDDSEIYKALELAQIDKFVSELSDGLDTEVGERGTKLSGGQRQRLAIARAILKDAPILLCDEATSSLDSTTEYKIQQAMKQLKSNRTTIIAAHRLSTVIDADRIFVLKEGKVVDEGSHLELMKSRSYYRELVEHQFRPFLENAEKNINLRMPELSEGAEMELN